MKIAEKNQFTYMHTYIQRMNEYVPALRSTEAADKKKREVKETKKRENEGNMGIIICPSNRQLQARLAARLQPNYVSRHH
jgi:hypothetical protein